MISVLLGRNNFIKNLLTAKSNDFRSLFVSAKYSRPYISIGIHFDIINSRMTSSDAFLPILPKIALSELKNDFLAQSREHLNCRLCTLYRCPVGLSFKFHAFRLVVCQVAYKWWLKCPVILMENLALRITSHHITSITSHHKSYSAQSYRLKIDRLCITLSILM